MTTRGPGTFVMRVLAGGGSTAGVGVLVTQSEMLTCAHVVNVALGLAPESRSAPRGVVNVCFPLLAEDGDKVYRARVEDWLPPPTKSAAGEDLARLLLLDLIPEETKPAVRDRDLARAGGSVQVFGYPTVPDVPGGCWADGRIVRVVGRQLLRLDSPPESDVRIQPGFAGSPVLDAQTGLVVGLLTGPVRSDARAQDSYAITVDQIGPLWPGPTAPPSQVPTASRDEMQRWVRSAHSKGEESARVAGMARRPGISTEEPDARVREEGLVVLHLSDLRFGPPGHFDVERPMHADRDQVTLFRSLAQDLATLGLNENLHPDLIVVTGDLTERGTTEEFDQVSNLLTRLAAELNLPRRRVVIVPGARDVKRLDGEVQLPSVRDSRRELEGFDRSKWAEYSAAFDRFYQGAGDFSFGAAQPWTMFEVPDLRVMVAGLNSTMAENRGHENHVGEVGAVQLDWFRERLAAADRNDWIRIAAVHNTVVRRAADDDSHLRDIDALDRALGGNEAAHLLLHGHAHDGRLHRLPSGLLALSASQCQILVLRRAEITRYARRYVVGEDRWVGDTRITPNGRDWRQQVRWSTKDVATVFPWRRWGKADTAATESGASFSAHRGALAGGEWDHQPGNE